MSTKESKINKINDPTVLWIVDAITEDGKKYVFHFMGTEAEAQERIRSSNFREITMRNSSKDVSWEDESIELDDIFR